MIDRNIKHFLSITVLALAAALTISGCSSSTTPSTTPANVTPKAGTTYTYFRHEKDSTSGKAATTAPDSTITAQVLSSGTTFQGKSNVVTIYDDHDTLRFVLESNNDVSVYKARFGSSGFLFINPSPWLTLPFGSKKSGVSLFSHDTTISYQGQQEKLTLTGTADYIGTDEVDTGASHTKIASGQTAKITITVVGTTPATVNISSTQTFSFDYSIGSYFHSTSNTIFQDIRVGGIITLLPGNTSFTEKILTSYSLIQ